MKKYTKVSNIAGADNAITALYIELTDTIINQIYSAKLLGMETYPIETPLLTVEQLPCPHMFIKRNSSVVDFYGYRVVFMYTKNKVIAKIHLEG
jgi:hypothetical protein